MNKRLFEIVTDSSTDLPESYFLEHNVECVHLGFLMENVNYEGEDGKKSLKKNFTRSCVPVLCPPLIR